MRYAFVMQLKAGCEEQYLQRHQQIWPELTELLKSYSIANYQIYLQPQSLQLFASFEATEDFDQTSLKREPLMQKWWVSMAPYMLTQGASDEPQSIELCEMFFLN
ncbi:MAG: L-rhamnose mutarotase [Pseudomonadales bacterium]|nr:L-rhamnose mutarotase [Pseudomonadales bacterium]